MKIVIAALLIMHGLIVAAQGTASTPAAGPIGLENPAFVSWWPTRFGQSWLLAGLGIERAPIVSLGRVLWIIGGVALVAAGLGVLQLVVPATWWRDLAIAGAAISLLLLALYLHPLYAIGIGADVVVLVALLWARWPSPELLGV